MRLLLAFVLLLISTLVFVNCAPFRNSPFSDQLFHPERDLNIAAIKRIQNVEADGKIRIAIYSDPHQNYKDMDATVTQINKATDIDFIVSLGDVTNSGYNFEYDQYLNTYVLFKHPVISVIGNHDAIGAGLEIFEKVFGMVDFWFESDSKRFVFFNAVNLEHPDAFNPNWLKEAIDTSSKPVFIFAHTSLRDKERYSGDTAQTFSDIIANPKVQMIFNGHNHVYGLTCDGDTVMLQSPRVEGAQWLIVEIQGTQVTITKQHTGESARETLKN